MKLTLTDLTKKFGAKTAVDHVNLEISHGIIGLLGPNGAGKTTLIRLLCDLLRPDDGAVLFDGENICTMGEDYRDMLGYLPQKMGYYPWFTAEKYLQYLAALKGLSAEEGDARASALLQQVGLHAERKKRLRTFSGGMLQRIGIAQALLNDPKILILDEPTAGLDPQERIRFRNMIAGFAQDRLVILSTHIVSDVEHMATKGILFRAGKIAACDTIDEICKTLDGKVCSVTVSTKEVEEFQQMYLIADVQPTGESVQLRLVCPDRIPEGAAIVNPELEDAYLFYCGKENPC